MNLLIIDIETSKTISGEEVPVEVAAIAYDTETRCVLGSFSNLIKQDNLLDKTTVHKIPNEAIANGNNNDILTVSDLAGYASTHWKWSPDYLIAHNAEFKQRFIVNDLDIPWLCTYADFDLFPSDYEGKRDLMSLAQWHGVGVLRTHRALYDCLLLAEIFNRIPDLKGEIEWALLPKFEWIAPRSAEHPPLGFRWDYTLQSWIGIDLDTIPEKFVRIKKEADKNAMKKTPPSELAGFAEIIMAPDRIAYKMTKDE